MVFEPRHKAMAHEHIKERLAELEVFRVGRFVGTEEALEKLGESYSERKERMSATGEWIEDPVAAEKVEDIWEERKPEEPETITVEGEVMPAIEATEEVKRKRRTKAEMEAEREQRELGSIASMSKTTEEKDEVFGLDKEYSAVEYAIEMNMPVLMIGQTGCGKTHLIRSIAHKQQKDLVRLSLNGEIGINELIGKWLVKDGSTYWQDGILVDCARNGRWIVVDEINSALPEVLFAMHSLLDDDHALVLAEKDGERVVAHPDFRLFAAMNPPDEYAGTREMNKALLSRFPIVLHINYYSPREELKIITYHSGIDIKAGKILIDIASKIRKLKEERKVWYTCSTRDIINAAKLFVGNKHSLSDVLNWSLRNKASKEEWDEIQNSIYNAAAIPIDLSWKHNDVEQLTSDLTADIEELKKQKQELSEVVEEFEARFRGVAARLGSGSK